MNSTAAESVSGITLVVGQRREITSRCCVISRTPPPRPAALHPERFFNLREALTPEEGPPHPPHPLCPALQKAP